jgi:glycosidase
MTWVLLAIRKQELRNRINQLTQKQIDISQEVMDLQSYASNIEDGVVTFNEMAGTPSRYYGTQIGFMGTSSQVAYNSAMVKASAYLDQLQQNGMDTDGQYQNILDPTGSGQYGDGTVQPAVLFNQIYKQELEEYAKKAREQINQQEKELEQERLQVEVKIKTAKLNDETLQTT